MVKIMYKCINYLKPSKMVLFVQVLFGFISLLESIPFINNKRPKPF